MDVVTELVIAPFRDIVEKGKTAADNAGDSQPMLKAAQALTKEGERALKRIEPLCKKHLDEYGSGFVDALKENGMFHVSMLGSRHPTLSARLPGLWSDALGPQMTLAPIGRSLQTSSGSLTTTSTLTASMPTGTPKYKACPARPRPGSTISS